MNNNNNSIINLQNEQIAVSIDLNGGSFSNVHAPNHPINPLSFVFTKEQMPQNNQAGAPYKGHFICLGRWGEPSAGEITKGIPNHGQFANLQWQIQNHFSETELYMYATSSLEGLSIQREIMLDNFSPVMFVKEVVENIGQLGRLYNTVQHPTLAAPFLDETLVVDSNATKGFNQQLYASVAENTIQWQTPSLNTYHPESTDEVLSFIIHPNAEYGWITAYSPTHNLVFGYIWKRQLYPWIHIWQHHENNAIKYLGLEFGTAGIHQPFQEIIHTATELFNEKTLDYIDAGEAVTKAYATFIFQTDHGFGGVENIAISNGQLQIKAKQQGSSKFFNLSEKIVYGL